jgi:hypothetical protein
MSLRPGLLIEATSQNGVGAAAAPATLLVARSGPASRKPIDRILAIHWYQGVLSVREETLRSLFALDLSPFRRSDREIVVRVSTPIRDSPGGR